MSRSRFEYSRYNYNVTDFYAPTSYRACDHDPVVVGLDVATAAAAVELNFLGINDFHGRIDANTVKFAGTIEQLRPQAHRSDHARSSSVPATTDRRLAVRLLGRSRTSRPSTC